MKNSYTASFFKIYCWQLVSIITRFLSIFLVTPFITQNQTLYGVYMVCIAVTVFLSYADIGFLSAATKYASECVIKKNLDEEVKILGFALFVLLIFTGIYVLGLLGLAFNPTLLINNLANPLQVKTASTLLFCLAFFSVLIVIGRILGLIFTIRLEDFVYQRISIFFNLITIFSIFLFFGHNKYYLVEYFVYSQLLIFCSLCIGIYFARKRYNYPFLKLLKSVTFSKEVYAKTKNLAFTSLYSGIVWILYFEIDIMVISSLLGVQAVAIYAPAITLAAFIRTFTGSLIFGPFQTRYNYFTGLNDQPGLKTAYLRTILLTMPIIILPLLAITLCMKSFIIAWIGPGFSETVVIGQLLIACYFLTFLGVPSALILNAKVKIKQLNIISTIILVLYWGGVALFFPILKLQAFAVLKLITFFISYLAYLYCALKALNIAKREILKLFKIIAIPSLFLIFCLRFLNHYLPYTQSKINMLIIILVGGSVTAISFALFILFSKTYRNELQQIKSSII